MTRPLGRGDWRASLEIDESLEIARVCVSGRAQALGREGFQGVRLNPDALEEGMRDLQLWLRGVRTEFQAVRKMVLRKVVLESWN